jgi:hypothetical protein
MKTDEHASVLYVEMRSMWDRSCMVLNIMSTWLKGRFKSIIKGLGAGRNMLEGNKV